MFRRLRAYEVIPLIAGGLLMVIPGHFTDIIGLVIVVLVVLLQFMMSRKDKNMEFNV